MDVPSWHPANADAQSRQLMGQSAAASQRTEFKLMPGSSADTSTDAGRELLNELTRGADGGSAAVEGRGFFDSSDRLYLQEQRRQETEELQRKRDQDRAELLKFRSTALKVQAEKAAALVAAATDLPETKKKPATASGSSSASVATVVIKPKKRAAPVAGNAVAKPAKQLKAAADTKAPKPQPTTATAVKTANACAGSLLVGYSSSDDSDGKDGEDDTGKDADAAATKMRERSRKF